MQSSSHPSRSSHLAHGLLACTLLLAGANGCVATYPTDAPFRCDTADDGGVGPCPSGFECRSGLCVRPGVSVPVTLSHDLDDTDTTFSVHARDDDFVVCWNQPNASQSPGVYGATVGFASDGDGVTTVPSRSLLGTGGYVSVPRYTLSGIAGDCALHGGQTVAMVDPVQSVSGLTGNVIQSYPEAYVQDDATPASRPVTKCPGLSVRMDVLRAFSAPRLSNLRSGNVTVRGSEQTWLIVPNLPAPSIPTVIPSLITVDYSGAEPMLCSTSLALSGYNTNAQIASMQVHSASHGAWFQIALTSGRSDFWWLDGETPQIADTTQTTVRPPINVDAHVPAYLRAVVLTTHAGDRFDEAIVGFQLDATHWQTWRVTSGNDLPSAGDTAHTPSTWAQGPSFTMLGSVLQPGGFVDANDQLFVAGSVDDPTRITLLSAPRTAGANDSFAVGTSLLKLSSVPVRRIELTQVGSRLTAAWTELVTPDPRLGMVQYTALYAAPLTGSAAR